MAFHTRELTLPEQLMLVALRDEKGTLHARAGHYRLALGGAILAELALEGRIEIGTNKKTDKRALVDLRDATGLGDPLLDGCLRLVAGAKRRRRAMHWVTKFSNLPKLRHRVARSLCRKGVLRDDEEQVLLFFKRKVYPTIDPGPEQRLLQGLRDAIQGSSTELDPRLSVLVALLQTTSMLRVYFERPELKERKQRLEQIASGDLVAGATLEAVKAVQAAQAAMIAATAAASVAATSAASG